MAVNEIDKAVQKLIAMTENKAEIKQVWKNASPTSAFAPQNLNIALTEYDLILVLSRINKGSASDGGSMQATIIPVGNGTYTNAIYGVSDPSTTPGFATRNVWANKSGVGFGAGWWHGVSASGGESNNYIIPQKIYAMKGVN